MGGKPRKALVPVVFLVEENCDSIASATFQTRNLRKYAEYEKVEDDLKEQMKKLLQAQDKTKEQILSEVADIITTFFEIDKKQDELIVSFETLASYIAKINRHSNGIIKKYDITGNYKSNFESRKTLLLGEIR